MASYPDLNIGGIKYQLPFTEIDEWVVAEATLDCGKSYTNPEHTDRLKRIAIEYSCLTRDELTVIEDFFNLMRGPVGEFELTVRFDDGSTITYPTCRFDQVELVVKYPEPGRFATDVKISVEP